MSSAGNPETIRLGPRQTLTVLSTDPGALELECTWTPGNPPPTHFLATDPGPLAKASLVWRFRHELRLGRPRG